MNLNTAFIIELKECVLSVEKSGYSQKKDFYRFESDPKLYPYVFSQKPDKLRKNPLIETSVQFSILQFPTIF